MVPLTALWLPILVSGVAIFIVTNILWMVLKFWHFADYKRFPDDKVFVDATRPLQAGMYVFPWMDMKTMTPEQREERHKGPSGLLYLRNPSPFSMGTMLLSWFLYCLFSAFCGAYLASETLPPGAPFLRVLQIAGATVTIFWAFGSNVSDSIWYGKPWASSIKHVVDGVIYGLIAGAVFAWLWPK